MKRRYARLPSTKANLIAFIKMKNNYKSNFDGKHWIGKRTPNGNLKISSYEDVANQVRKALGAGGIVAIPNARGEGNKLGAEFRFEEFYEMANPYKVIKEKSHFYDKERDIYFIKAQEIHAKDKDSKITFLVYNLPFNENLEEGNLENVLEESVKKKGIIGITGPSCIGNLERIGEENSEFFGYVDFFVGWSGGALNMNDNLRSLDFYDQNLNLKNKKFKNPKTGEEHLIGCVSVSGGHRSPKGLDRLINSKTIGTNYTTIKTPEENKFDENKFTEDLRKSLRESTISNSKTKLNVKDMVIHGFSLKIADPVRKILGRY